MNNSYKKFLKDLAKVFLAFLLVTSPILYFNVIIDPYSVFLNKVPNTFVEPNKRFLKVNHIVNNPDKFNSFIFGSSRVNSVNPQNIPGETYYNMTYSMGYPEQHLKDIRTFHSNGVVIKNLLVGLDYKSLMNETLYLKGDLLRMEYPTTFYEKIQFYSSYFFIRPTIEMIKTATKSIHYLDKSEIFTTGVTYNRKSDSILSNNPAKHISRLTFSIPSSNYIKNTKVDEAILVINKLIEYCKEHDINLKIFIHPTHITSYTNLNLDEYFYALKELSRISDYWDFSGLNSIASDNMFHYETSHFTRLAGDKITSKIYDNDTIIIPDDFGRYVSKDNIDDHIKFHKSLISNYTKSVCDLYEYLPPFDLSGSKVVLDNQDIAISSINGIPSHKFTDTMLLTTPWLSLKFRPALKNSKADISQLYVQIGDRIFPVSDYLVNDSVTSLSDNQLLLNKEYEVIIPTSQLENGIQKLVSFIKMGDTINYNELNYQPSINVLKTKKIIPFDSLRRLKQRAVFNIDKINGLPTGKFHDLQGSSFINIGGWAVEPDPISKSGGVIVLLDEKPYLSHFVYKRQDVTQHLGNKNAKYCGWGISIPCHDLVPGSHVLSFLVLNKNQDAYYPVRNSITFTSEQVDAMEVLEPLTPIAKKTRFSIDQINGQSRRNQVNPIKVNGSRFSLSGWAIDYPEQSTASNVIVEIDGKFFNSSYGYNRPDVARSYKLENIAKCGWNIDIPIREIEKGEHTINIYIVNKDSSGYYLVVTDLVVAISR
jgi:hypothetical protein